MMMTYLPEIAATTLGLTACFIVFYRVHKEAIKAEDRANELLGKEPVERDWYG